MKRIHVTMAPPLDAVYSLIARNGGASLREHARYFVICHTVPQLLLHPWPLPPYSVVL